VDCLRDCRVALKVETIPWQNADHQEKSVGRENPCRPDNRLINMGSVGARLKEENTHFADNDILRKFRVADDTVKQFFAIAVEIASSP
jgi:hypothetical protein